MNFFRWIDLNEVDVSTTPSVVLCHMNANVKNSFNVCSASFNVVPVYLETIPFSKNL